MDLIANRARFGGAGIKSWSVVAEPTIRTDLSLGRTLLRCMRSQSGPLVRQVASKILPPTFAKDAALRGRSPGTCLAESSEQRGQESVTLLDSGRLRTPG